MVMRNLFKAHTHTHKFTFEKIPGERELHCYCFEQRLNKSNPDKNNNTTQWKEEKKKNNSHKYTNGACLERLLHHLHHRHPSL